MTRHVRLAGVEIPIRQVVLDGLLAVVVLAAFVAVMALLVAVAG